MWNDYLNAIIDPKLKDVTIPDQLMFPFSTVQSVTTGILKSSSAGEFCLAFAPDMEQHGFIFDGSDTPPLAPASISVDGTVYAQGSGFVFPTAVLSSLESTAYAYRPVSMGVYIEYTGPPLTAAGRIVSACVPPPFDEDGLLESATVDRLARYNYSSSFKAIDGCTQIWFPFDPRSRNARFFVQDNFPYNTFPFIVIAGAGLPTAQTVFTVRIFCNFEIFSTAQILTAQNFRVASSAKIDHATSTVSAVAVKNGGNHAGTEEKHHKPFILDAIETGANIAAKLAPVAAMFL